MAVFKDTSFEGVAGDEGFSDTSTDPAVLVADTPYEGTKSLRCNVSDGSAYPEGWVRWRFPTPPSTASFRTYLLVDEWNAAFEGAVLTFSEPAVGHYLEFRVVESGSVYTLKATLDNPTYDLGSTVISLDTYYRVEWKLDWSGTGWKITWGIAEGEGSLTTIATDATGGNTLAADTIDYLRFGSDAWAVCIVHYDAVKITDSGADYPLGGLVATQTLLPDADIATTGWTSTPLFSKLNDASDATVITATAS